MYVCVHTVGESCPAKAVFLSLYTSTSPPFILWTGPADGTDGSITTYNPPPPIRTSVNPSIGKDVDLQEFLVQVVLLLSALLILFREMRCMSAERTRYFHRCKHWIKLSFGLLSTTTAILQFCFQSHARSCVSEVTYKSYITL